MSQHTVDFTHSFTLPTRFDGLGRPPRRKFGLTAREVEVLPLLVLGYTCAEVGRALSISPETVKRHCSHIYEKVGVSNRLELALFSVYHGLIDSTSVPETRRERRPPQNQIEAPMAQRVSTRPF